MEGPLTLLSAPAGFGKTTLLTSWLHSNGTPGAWFSVEPEDNDPVRFFTYFIAALQQLDQHLSARVLPLLQSPQAVPLETVLALLVNELNTWQGSDLALVLLTGRDRMRDQRRFIVWVVAGVRRLADDRGGMAGWLLLTTDAEPP